MHTFAPPPRRVPPSLRVVNFFNPWAQGGWALFGFGMIFFWVFAGNADYSFATFRDVTGRAVGRVLETEQTGASEGKRPVHSAHYEFSVAGRTFEGTSYVTGPAPDSGANVDIEFDEDDPSRSRIAGMRRAMFGPAAAVVTVFPFIGLVFLLFGTRSGVRRNRLLQRGMFTRGKLISVEPTNMTVNRRRVMALKFEFQDRLGQKHVAVARTSETERLEDEASEALLYDPENPSYAYLLDEVPSRPQVEMNGDLKGRPMAGIAALILPGIVIGGHLLYFVLR